MESDEADQGGQATEETDTGGIPSESGDSVWVRDILMKKKKTK